VTAQERGFDFLTARKYVRQHHGEEGVRALTARLAERGMAGAMTDVILPNEWRPFAEYLAVCEGIEGLFSSPEQPHAARRYGRFQVDDQLKYYHRIAMRVLKPAWLIENAMGVWRKYCDAGRWEISWPRPNQAVARLVDMVPISPPFCQQMAGFFERFLEVCRVREILVVHPECVTRGMSMCRYDVSWR